MREEIKEFWKNVTDPQLEGEEWRDVPGYEGCYQVSNLGRVKSLTRKIFNQKAIRPGKIFKQNAIANKHYLRVGLQKDGVGKCFPVHRLVALAFINNKESKPLVNHIDGIKTNNTVDNLEWVTHSENSLHASRVLRAVRHRVIFCVETGQKFMSMKEASEHFGFNSTGGIEESLKNPHRTVKGLHFIDAENYYEGYIPPLKNRPYSKGVVCVETKEIFPSMGSAAKSKELNHKHISKCTIKKHLTHGGFHWCLLNEWYENYTPPPCPQIDYTYMQKKVVCLNSGIVYDSVKQAAIALGLHKGSISASARSEGVRQAGFLRFRYV